MFSGSVRLTLIVSAIFFGIMAIQGIEGLKSEGSHCDKNDECQGGYNCCNPNPNDLKKCWQCCSSYGCPGRKTCWYVILIVQMRLYFNGPFVI